MQLNEEQKQRVLQQLSDMFSGVPQGQISSVCEQQDWNVENCIDYLISDNGECHEVDKSEPTRLQKNKYHINHGAIPKTSNNNNGDLHAPECSATVAPVTKNNNLSFAEQRIVKNVIAGYRVMIIMRGAPGSGKSTIAKELLERCISLPEIRNSWQEFILSTDDFFLDNSGRYKYNIQRLDEAHSFNQRRTRDKASSGWSPIIVDNTNMMLWEMLPYVQIAVRHGYLVELLEPKTPWRKSAGKLAMNNRHRVPRDKIQLMLDRYEEANVNDLMKMLKETKYRMQLPQMRMHPPIINGPPDDETKETITNQLKAVGLAEVKNDKENKINVPKPKRDNTKLRSTPEIPKLQQQENKNDENLKFYDKAPPNVWQSYEEETTKFWGTSSQNANNLSMGVADGVTAGPKPKTLLELLREGETTEQSEEDKVGGAQRPQSKFKRHRINCRNENRSFASLRQIYPNKEITGLWDLFVKCNGDIDWVVDILLKEDELSNGNDDFSITANENTDSYFCDCDGFLMDSAENGVETPSALAPVTTSIGTAVKPQRQRIRGSRHIQRTNADMLEVKETIENRFVLGEEHYPKHMRKIRDRRDNRGQEGSEKIHIDAEAQTDLLDEEQEEYSDEIVEVSLDQNFVQQLKLLFKAETTLAEQLPDKLNTNIFIPRTLAKELYMLWVESVYNEIEEHRQDTLREDENFARLLKNPKYEHCMQSPSNTQELLDMEMAWTIYNSEQHIQQQELQQPNDLASHLTYMKLCEVFPNIPRETLLDILVAHGNSYSETVEELRSTMGEGKISNMALTQDKLIECAFHENEKLLNQQANIQKDQVRNGSTHSIDSNGSGEHIAKFSVSQDEAKRLALRDFEDTRNLAQHHCQLKAECYQKAKEAIQKGNSAVAVYYSQIANLHKMKIDMYNHRAANCIIDVHKYTQNNPDLLDLHYLHVVEAVGCLDLFLDRHITGLRSAPRTYKHVFIITGRGLHSAGGISTIKNKAKNRLKERGLKWREVNPGLLKVKLFSASRHSQKCSTF